MLKNIKQKNTHSFIHYPIRFFNWTKDVAIDKLLN